MLPVTEAPGTEAQFLCGEFALGSAQQGCCINDISQQDALQEVAQEGWSNGVLL